LFLHIGHSDIFREILNGFLLFPCLLPVFPSDIGAKPSSFQLALGLHHVLVVFDSVPLETCPSITGIHSPLLFIIRVISPLELFLDSRLLLVLLVGVVHLLLRGWGLIHEVLLLLEEHHLLLHHLQLLLYLLRGAHRGCILDEGVGWIAHGKVYLMGENRERRLLI